MYKLCRFYCCPCDQAWAEIVSEETYSLPCEYCRKPCEAEEDISSENKNKQ